MLEREPRKPVRLSGRDGLALSGAEPLGGGAHRTGQPRSAPAVRAGRRGHRPDQAGDHVAQRVPLARFGAVRSDVLPRPTVQPLRARGHRDQIAEPVSAVHVQALGYGPEAVRRVQVAVAPDRMLDPPAALVVVGELELAQIMQIAALRVQQLAEQALADHTENHHLGAVVADVLHHHAVPAGRGRPAPSTRVCILSTFSGTMSHTAVIATPSILRKFWTWLDP